MKFKDVLLAFVEVVYVAAKDAYNDSHQIVTSESVHDSVKEEGKWQKAHSLWNVLASVMIAVATIANVGVSIFLWHAASQSNAVATRAAKAAETQAQTARDQLTQIESAGRAYLTESVPTLTMIDSDVPGQFEFDIRPNWRNSGTTTTIGLRSAFACRMMLTGFDSKMSPIEPTNKTYNNTVGANADYNAGDQRLSLEAASLVNKHSSHLFCLSVALYRDIFTKVIHETQGCRELINFITSAHIIEHTEWVNCPMHNCVDEECKGQSFASDFPTMQSSAAVGSARTR